MNKKLIRNILFAGMLASLASCYKDDGNYDYITLPDVKIEMDKQFYADQFSELEIPVSINLDGDAEADYEYTWRLWSDEIKRADYKKTISNDKDLKFQVNELAGSYTLTFTAHNKRTNVDTYKQATLVVQGAITEGWMVLQEKDGKTDFDLIMTPFFSKRVQEDKIFHDLYQSVNGEQLEGRGVKIGSQNCFNRYQFVTVLTDKGGARLYAETMQKAFDMSSLITDGKPWKPENYIFWHYWWSPGRYAYDAIISDGRFYEYTPMETMGIKFTSYTEPILKDGRTYKSAKYAPRLFDYKQGIIFDELQGGFVSIEKNTYVLGDMPDATGQMFDWNHMNGSLKYIDTGQGKKEYGVIEDWDTHKKTLYCFNFDTKKNIAAGMYAMDNCPEIDDAQYYAVGERGPVFYYATDRNVYLYDYSGTNTARVAYTLENSAEKITGMKLLKPCVYISSRVMSSHDYDNKVLILSTYNADTKEGKVYMFYVNEGNGTIDSASQKVFGGFGEILDMDYNWPKTQS